jgi:hypothetical protein
VAVSAEASGAEAGLLQATTKRLRLATVRMARGVRKIGLLRDYSVAPGS